MRYVVLFMIASSFFFFFKQKTAYEMRISDWSSDVCSSDLAGAVRLPGVSRWLHCPLYDRGTKLLRHRCLAVVSLRADAHMACAKRGAVDRDRLSCQDRKSVV